MPSAWTGGGRRSPAGAARSYRGTTSAQSRLRPCHRASVPRPSRYCSLPNLSPSSSHASRHPPPHRRQRRHLLSPDARARHRHTVRAVAVREPARRGTAWASSHGSSSPMPSCTGACLHLAFNMFALYMFGGAIEQVFGGRRYFLYYMACVVSAAIAQLLVAMLSGAHLSDGRRLRRRLRPAARLRDVFSRTTA